MNNEKVDGCAKFQRLGKLGEGTFGVVYKALNTQTGQLVALKRIRLSSDQEGVPCTAIREISLLKELDHENIIKLYEIVHDPDKLTLVFELCDLDLKNYMEECHGPIPLYKIKDFLYQLCTAVAFCHKERVLHRDLKPQNLLITRTANGEILKLADFGLARCFSVPVRSYSHEVVTLWYRAPEILMGSHTYSKPIDIWSIGCIFGEMQTGYTLFKGKNAGDQLERIFIALGTPLLSDYPEIVKLPQYENVQQALPFYPPNPLNKLVPGLPDDAYDLLTDMLLYNPLKRITAQKAADHPFLAEIKSSRKGTK